MIPVKQNSRTGKSNHGGGYQNSGYWRGMFIGKESERILGGNENVLHVQLQVIWLYGHLSKLTESYLSDSKWKSQKEEKQILYGITHTQNLKMPNLETETKMVFTRVQGERRYAGQRVQTYSYMMNKLQGSNAQRNDSTQ